MKHLVAAAPDQAYTVPYMLDQRPLLYKGRTQIVASLASKMKHLVAALK